jgi:uncharacterized protein
LPIRVAITGASGLVGSALGLALAARGDEVIPLVRSATPQRPGAALWDPETERIDASAIEDLDAVVHLAGESIAGGRWTSERRRRIRDSRVLGTRLLCRTLARLERPPRVLISASAVGYYGDRGDEWLDERSSSGIGFISELCRAWEAEVEPAATRGVRVVRLRLGLVLTARGGALGSMLPLFRLGLGGRLGSGRQHLSFVTLPDLLALLKFAIDTDSLRGPVNAVAPHPSTNAAFTRALARRLSRPAILPVPGWALRAALGGFASELLASRRVTPSAAVRAGFAFAHATLESALATALEA